MADLVVAIGTFHDVFFLLGRCFTIRSRCRIRVGHHTTVWSRRFDPSYVLFLWVSRDEAHLVLRVPMDALVAFVDELTARRPQNERDLGLGVGFIRCIVSANTDGVVLMRFLGMTGLAGIPGRRHRLGGQRPFIAHQHRHGMAHVRALDGSRLEDRKPADVTFDALHRGVL